jgi:hypothetical protein
MKVKSLRQRFYRKTGGPRQIGHRCKAHFPGCIVCESYRFLDEHGRFPTFDEVAPICDEESRKEHEAWLETEAGRDWQAKRRNGSEA